MGSMPPDKHGTSDQNSEGSEQKPDGCLAPAQSAPTSDLTAPNDLRLAIKKLFADFGTGLRVDQGE